jgi:hypothetical protein
MNDTSNEIYQKQREIILNMSVKKRIELGFDIIDFGYESVRKRLNQKSWKKQVSASDVFLEYYKNEFDKKELDRIIDFLTR